jgi:hypothetical protein
MTLAALRVLQAKVETYRPDEIDLGDAGRSE